MTLVVDASVVGAALVDSGPDGQCAEGLLEPDHLAAPHLMPAEATNIPRRATQAGPGWEWREQTLSDRHDAEMRNRATRNH